VIVLGLHTPIEVVGVEQFVGQWPTLVIHRQGWLFAQIARLGTARFITAATALAASATFSAAFSATAARRTGGSRFARRARARLGRRIATPIGSTTSTTATTTTGPPGAIARRFASFAGGSVVLGRLIARFRNFVVKRGDPIFGVEFLDDLDVFDDFVLDHVFAPGPFFAPRASGGLGRPGRRRGRGDRFSVPRRRGRC
jgi:hypothetical protein